MWLSWKFLGLLTPAVYRYVTALRRTQAEPVADCGAKPDRSRNAADSIHWKFGVSNITKHLERAHNMKLKECSVFDCYNEKSKASSSASRSASSPASRSASSPASSPASRSASSPASNPASSPASRSASSPASAEDCSTWQQHLVLFLWRQVTEFVFKLKSLQLARLSKTILVKNW